MYSDQLLGDFAGEKSVNQKSPLMSWMIHDRQHPTVCSLLPFNFERKNLICDDPK